MNRKIWLAAVIIGVLLAAHMLRMSPTPAPADGVDVPTAAPTDAGVVPIVPVPMEVLFPTVDTPEPVAVPIMSTPTAAPAESTATARAEVIAEQEGLRAIDAYAKQERQRIETWYSSQLAELKTQLEQRLQKLDGIEKLAWAQFHQRANETWSDTSSYQYGSGGRSETTYTRVMGNPAGEYAAILARIKDSKQAKQQDFVKAQERLVWMREQELAAVQAEVDRRKAGIALRKSRDQMEAARRLSGDSTPIVEAICAGAGNRLCALVDGALVSEGDVVQGYSVRKVHADRVEFEKEGEVWVQQMQ